MVLSFNVWAKPTGSAVKAELLVQGYDVIWSMAQISSRKILFTTRNGTFQLLELPDKKVTPVKAALKVFNRGQGGLMDLKLHPDFDKNKKIYFTYSCEKSLLRNTTCLGTAIFNEKKMALESMREIFAAEPAINSSLHFGSRLAWDDEQHLFMTMGERFSHRDLAQSLETHLGKILRLDENGRAATGNPFAATSKAKPEIWSYGHRNPQGLFYDSKTKTLWEHEHAAKGGDEINRIEKGKNYGWPVITHGVGYSGEKIGIGSAKEGMEQPLYTYIPSIAPSGLIVYSGKKYSQYKDFLFLGALVLEHLNQIEITKTKTNETRLFETLHERVRTVLETEDGDILFSTDSGKIFRVQF